jgi:hypothetical protein
MTSLAELPVTQRAALHACVSAGELRRAKGGYTDSKKLFTARAVFALERAELIENVDGTTVFRPTPAGVSASQEL